MHRICTLMLFILASTTAYAQDFTVHKFDGSFDDATFAAESAIVGQGLKIDHISHTGEMLARTGADLGATKEIFKGADIFLFCSAVLSRKVMEINPMNIAHCPYSIFVIETENGVEIGYRNQPEGEMQEVQALLERITAEAAE